MTVTLTKYGQLACCGAIIQPLMISKTRDLILHQAGGKDCKAELRDHDHVVECVAWAPEAATQVTQHISRDGKP